VIMLRIIDFSLYRLLRNCLHLPAAHILNILFTNIGRHRHLWLLLTKLLPNCN